VQKPAFLAPLTLVGALLGLAACTGGGSSSSSSSTSRTDASPDNISMSMDGGQYVLTDQVSANKPWEDGLVVVRAELASDERILRVTIVALSSMRDTIPLGTPAARVTIEDDGEEWESDKGSVTLTRLEREGLEGKFSGELVLKSSEGTGTRRRIEDGTFRISPGLKRN
jgi:hypothetical protein